MIVGRCTSLREIQPEYILIFVYNFSNSLAMPFETVMTASAFFSKCLNYDYGVMHTVLFFS